MTTNPSENMTPEQVRGFLADVANYTGKPAADSSWADLEKYRVHMVAQHDQDTARMAHMNEIQAIMDRHRDLAAITPTMGALLDAMPPEDAARLCRLQELTGLLDGDAR